MTFKALDRQHDMLMMSLFINRITPAIMMTNNEDSRRTVNADGSINTTHYMIDIFLGNQKAIHACRGNNIHEINAVIFADPV